MPRQRRSAAAAPRRTAVRATILHTHNTSARRPAQCPRTTYGINGLALRTRRRVLRVRVGRHIELHRVTVSKSACATAEGGIGASGAVPG